MSSIRTDITVVIVNYKVKEYVADLLDSLFANSRCLELEVIVIDNNSGDDSEQYLKSRYPQITFIQNSQNEGFSKASNQGIKRSESTYTLLINPDTKVQQGTLEKLISYMERHTLCGVAGCKVLKPDGSFAPESRRSYLTLWSSLCALLGLHYLFPKSRWFAQRYLGWLDPEEESVVPVVSGAFMFWRTEVLKSLNGFDERFFMYTEDDDICLRLKQTRYHAAYVPSAAIIHYKGMSKGSDHLRYIRSFTDSLHLYFKKHYPSMFIVVYKPFIYLAFLIKTTAAKLKKGLRARRS